MERTEIYDQLRVRGFDNPETAFAAMSIEAIEAGLTEWDDRNNMGLEQGPGLLRVLIQRHEDRMKIVQKDFSSKQKSHLTNVHLSIHATALARAEWIERNLPGIDPVLAETAAIALNAEKQPVNAQTIIERINEQVAAGRMEEDNGELPDQPKEGESFSEYYARVRKDTKRIVLEEAKKRAAKLSVRPVQEKGDSLLSKEQDASRMGGSGLPTLHEQPENSSISREITKTLDGPTEPMVE